MPVIVPPGQLNPAALTADDLYVQILNPPGYVKGVATDVIGIVGTASWGPVNTPVHIGSAQEAGVKFAPIAAVALTDPFDLATDLALAFGQAGSAASLEGWAVRVTDGTDVAASNTLAGTASSAALTVTLTGTITNGDTYQIRLTSTAIAGSPVNLTIPIVTGDTLTTAAAKGVAAINANVALSAAGIFASNVAGVISIFQPTALSPQAVLTATSGTTIIATGGTGATATIGATVRALFTGTYGNSIAVNLTTGTAPNTFTLTVVPPTGVQELFPNIPTGPGAGLIFWKNLASAVNAGLSNVRGPSQWITITGANDGVGAPSGVTATLAGGTDGRAGVVTATLLGSDTATPRTGLYALRQQTPPVGVAWIVGSTDSTTYASALAFAQTEGLTFLATIATGVSTTAAAAAVSANGIRDPAFAYVKDWVYFFDPINNLLRLVPPTAIIGGVTATLSPEQSPGNKPVNLVSGTERYNPITGILPYTISEIGQLEQAGIMLITNPIPAGNQWGIRHGQTTSLNLATAPVEYWRLTSFLARSFAATMGQFVGQLQSVQVNDPVRNAVKNQLNTFLQQLKGNGQIDNFSVVCTLNTAPTAVPGSGVNTPTSIAQHYLYALVRVRYLASVKFFILSLQGGTTVVTVGSTPGTQLAA